MLTSICSRLDLILNLRQQTAKIFVQWISQHLLDRPSPSLAGRILAPAGGLPQHLPVRCTIAAAAKPLGVHEGLQEVDRVSIELFPVARHKLDHTTEKVR